MDRWMDSRVSHEWVFLFSGNSSDLPNSA